MLSFSEEHFYEDIESFCFDLIKNFKNSLIYFHNFGFFDSRFLLEYFEAIKRKKESWRTKYGIKTRIRKGICYEI